MFSSILNILIAYCLSGQCVLYYFKLNLAALNTHRFAREKFKGKCHRLYPDSMASLSLHILEITANSI